jgi:glycerol-3-phosphate cytidylyltransferase-like family protein
MKSINSLRYVNFCFPVELLEKKAEYIEYYKTDVLVMFDDWDGKLDFLKELREVVYLPRTPSISTNELSEVICSRAE